MGGRDVTIPEVIASGCDVILFADEPERDMDRVRRALADGRIPGRGSRMRCAASLR